MTAYIPSLTLPMQVFANPVASTLLPIALGTAIGYSTRPNTKQADYLSIRHPPYNPPAWVFGPVWTVLYGLMGYGAHRAISTGLGPLATPAMSRDALHGATLYTIQLGLNLAWMPLFFGLRRPKEAMVDIVALLGVTGCLTYVWSRVDSVAAWCLAPYLGWLSFATYLNGGVGYLNNWTLKKGVVKGSKKTDSKKSH